MRKRKLTPQLAAERDAVVSEIESAFPDEPRPEGVYWEQHIKGCKARQPFHSSDDYWREVVGNPNWKHKSGWPVPDARAFRFYLPAMMTRNLSSTDHSTLVYLLTIRSHGFSDADEADIRQRRLSDWAALDASQLRCVRRFLRYMSDLWVYMWRVDEVPQPWQDRIHEVHDTFDVNPWRLALKNYWDDIDTGDLPD